jgi:formyltetrahydrofolate-dependent phosphoribosylglycinamide formyltransferase
VTGLGVLVSGGGSNFEALARACGEGDIPDTRIHLLISNKPGVGALDRAARAGIESFVLEPKHFSDRTTYFERLAEELKKRGVDVVCLAGFLLKVEPNFIHHFPGRILNIHPSLLPKFGGKGMYGTRVHEAVLSSREEESGCTVHLVDEEFDHGPLLAQSRVPVLSGDTPATLAARVLVEEHRLYPEAVRDFIRGLKKENA